MDQCWNGQFYQISIRGPDCDTAPDPVADPRENDGRLWLWWGTKENERTASSPVADPKRMNGFGPRTGSRRRWTDGFGPCDGSEENERLRIRINGSEDLTTQKRGFWYLLHSEIGSRASSKKRFYFLESQQFRIFSRNRSLLIRTKRATQRTNRPLPTIETQVNQVVYIFF